MLASGCPRSRHSRLAATFLLVLGGRQSANKRLTQLSAVDAGPATLDVRHWTSEPLATKEKMATSVSLREAAWHQGGVKKPQIQVPKTKNAPQANTLKCAPAEVSLP